MCIRDRREGRPFTCETMNYATFLVKLVQQIEGNELEQAARVIDEIYCDFLQKLYYPEDIFEMTDMVVLSLIHICTSIYGRGFRGLSVQAVFYEYALCIR